MTSAAEALAAALHSIHSWDAATERAEAAAILAALDGYVLVPVGLVEAAREVVDATTSYVIRDAAIRTALAALRAALEEADRATD